MFNLNRLTGFTAVVALALLVGGVAEAKPRKVDKLMGQGRAAEQKGDYDKALDLFEQAVMADPADPGCILAMRRARFQAGQRHVDLGQKLRKEGKLEEALAEFRKAYTIDPSSSIAEQELRRTREMIEREKKDGQKGEKPTAEERGMTAAQRARKEIEERIASALPAPELKPISRQPITLRMNNQPPRVLFETVGKLAGVNVIMDPDYATMGAQPKNLSVELNNATLEEALDYLGVLTKSFWKPLSANTILVAQDNITKRRDFEDQVVKVFYITNITQPQELQEITSAIRGIIELRRVYTYNAQNAIIVRGTVDQVALAEKLIQDMDKPKAEVVVDVIVMEANRSRTRDLASALASGGAAGLSSPIHFTPRNPVLLGGSTTTSDTTTTTATTGGTASQLISLARIGKISTNDFSVNMPGALIQAMMTDRSTRVLQQPQVRAVDGQKASLRIGDKTPIASGSFSPGVGAIGGNMLVNTQFQFLDVGVNVDITPKIHGPEEVSLHVELEISTVKDRIDLGGISQPVIGQRKVIHDIRIRQGEVNVLGGLMQGQRTRSTAGVPGLASVPGLKWLFSNKSTDDSDSELLILLVPHIVRTPDISDVNLRAVAVGTDQVVKMNFAPRKAPPPPVVPAPAPAETRPAAPPLPFAPPAGVPAPKPAPAGPPKLSFTPATLDVQAGATVILRLEMANGRDLVAAPLRIKFDPKVLKLNEISNGNLLGGDSRQVIFTRNIRNDAGEASVNLNRLPGAGGISGTGTLVTLEFQVVGRGAAKVAVGEIGLKDSRMQPITVAPAEMVINAR